MIQTWEERADCKDRDPRLWDGEDEYSTQQAKKICFGCPVIDKCLIDAMVNEEKFTVRGAHTAEEREQIRPDFFARHNMGLLRTQYKRKDTDLGGRQEKRLEKSRLARKIIPPTHPKFDEYREVLDLVIAKPWATAEELGRRISRSSSYVQHTLCEAWEVAV